MEKSRSRVHHAADPQVRRDALLHARSRRLHYRGRSEHRAQVWLMEIHMIEVLPDFPDGVVAMRCAGHVTRQDYEQVVIPTLEAALQQHQKLRMYCQVDSLSGMTPGAMWDDVKVGLPAITHFK